MPGRLFAQARSFHQASAGASAIAGARLVPRLVPTSTPASRRYDRLDALRGVAIVWMTAYHFCFDLNHFGWIRQNFLYDPFWTTQRTAIVSLFLFCAGLGQAVAHAQGQGLPRFWRRWAQIAGCALLVGALAWLVAHTRSP